MQLIVDGKDFIIKNGKIEDETYPHDFHSFVEHKGLILEVYIIIPGISPHSLHIQISDDILTITATINKFYRKFMKSKEIKITGKLKYKVLPNSYTSEYQHGILKLSLVITDTLSIT